MLSEMEYFSNNKRLYRLDFYYLDQRRLMGDIHNKSIDKLDSKKSFANAEVSRTRGA